MKPSVLIVGGGPSGTSTALALAQKGISSAIVEQEQFPRFHIGESMTGECGADVRALCLESKMKESRHPIKHGTRIFGTGGKNEFYIPVMGRTEDGKLVDQSTWQVRRSDFDAMLLKTCKDQGVEIIEARAIDILKSEEGTINGLRVRRADGKKEDIHCDVVVDASGQKTFLSTVDVVSEKERGNYDKQVAIFSHFRGAVRDDGKLKDDTLIFYQKKHHWAWFIPLDEEIVSIGVVTPSHYFKASKESRDEFLAREMRELNPELAKRVHNIETVDKVRAVSNYSYHIRNFTGRNFLCVGDSHRFIDPIFSFGLFLAMAEARKAAESIEKFLKDEAACASNPFMEYQIECERGQDTLQTLLDTFWNTPLAFALYVHNSKYRGHFIDMFAGRIYDEEPNPGLAALQKYDSRPRSVAS